MSKANPPKSAVEKYTSGATAVADDFASQLVDTYAPLMLDQLKIHRPDQAKEQAYFDAATQLAQSIMDFKPGKDTRLIAEANQNVRLAIESLDPKLSATEVRTAVDTMRSSMARAITEARRAAKTGAALE